MTTICDANGRIRERLALFVFNKSTYSIMYLRHNSNDQNSTFFRQEIQWHLVNRSSSDTDSIDTETCLLDPRGLIYFKVGFYLKAVFPSRNLGLMPITVSSSHESMFCGVVLIFGRFLGIFGRLEFFLID